MQTRRELIAAALEDQIMTPTEITALCHEHGISITPAGAVDEVEAIARGEDVRAAPPRCRACGFDGFDRLANIPSRCPSCRSERIAEPEFTIGDPSSG